MSCNLCDGKLDEINEFPFIIELKLLDDYHEKIYIHKCKICGTPYLGIKVDAYEDTHGYWVKITEQEKSEYTKLKNEADFSLKVVKFIESKESHIYKDYEGSLRFIKGKASVLYGLAPW